MNVSERLYNLRKGKNLSQEELANVLGVSRQSISKWETGESTPDFDKIIPLCNFYGITSDELLSGKKNIVEAENEQKTNNFARNVAISVGLYIISIVAIIVSTVIYNEPIIGVSIFFTIIAIATSLIVYSGIKYDNSSKKKKKEKEKNTITNQICRIIWLIGVIAYFIISFATKSWHITWIIFIITILCTMVFKLIVSLKNDKNESSDNNE